MISIFRPPTCPKFPTVEALNRDVTPKHIHSHNDYWRKRPLFDALLLGCISVEADIWKFDEDYTVTDTYTQSTASFSADEIYVGHNQMHLEAHGTLEKMYLEPLAAVLESANKKKRTKKGSDSDSGFGFVHGVFFDDPGQTLDLWIDIKTDAAETYRWFERALRPFVEKGYVSSYSEKEGIVMRPITVTLTGNVPWALLQQMSTRHVFLDCPLHEFELASPETLQSYETLCRYASTLYGHESSLGSFRETPSNPVRIAHDHGIKARLWGGPEWPRARQKAYWGRLLLAGYDLINTDHIAYAANEY